MKKIILTLGTTMVAFSPALAAISCGDDKPAISEEQTKVNADREQLTSFNKTSDVAISILEANKTTNNTTFVAFDQTKATALGFGTLPTLTNGSTVTYSLVQSTAVVGSKATYSLVLKATKGASSATTAAKTLTSSDNVTNTQNEVNADRDQLTSFNKTSDVAFTTLEGKKTTNADTFAAFDQATATALGFGTLPTLTNGSTVTYSLVQSTAVVGQKGTYSLVLKATKDTVSATTAAKVLTSSDNVSATIVADNMSADEVMTALNSHLNIFMPMKASDLIKDENKAAFLTYLREIKTDTPVVFKNGANEHEMDFSSLQTDIDATIDIIENDKHADNKAFAGDIASGNYGQSKNMPAITAYVGATMGTFFAFGKVAGSLTPFYAISEIDYISPSETLPAGNPVEVLAANPFIAMQFKLNTIFEGLTQSNAFQGWETGKDYNLAFSFPTASGAIQSKFRNGTVKSGSLFDATQLAMLTASGLKAGQGSSNFEALFANKFFKFSTDISNTTSIDSTLMQSPSYSTKEDLIAAYSEISESNFVNSTYANKLSVIPNNWVQITHGNIDTASMTTNSVMYIAPTAGNANDPIATYYLVFDQTLEVMKTAASITDKYLGFTKSTGEADGLAAVSATGWEFTQNKDLPALASASVKFYRAAASTALSGYFYRATALSTDHNDLVTAWNSYKGATITPQISSSLDAAALEAKKSNTTWTDLTTEVAAEFGINVTALNIPAGCTLQFTTGLTAANAMAPGATANSKYLNINIRLKKGTEISYAKLNAFRLFEMVA